jgi:transposase InsO family protein
LLTRIGRVRTVFSILSNGVACGARACAPRSAARIDGAGHRAHGNRGRQKRRRGTKRIGYEYVHVCVDDATRLAYVEVLPDEKARTAVGFLRRARIWYRRHGVRIRRVMTDNGACYVSALHALACRRLDVKHLRTRPRRPRTNGKAERFIRTMLAGWAYGAIYATSKERTDALEGWLHTYNHTRPTRQPRPQTTHTPATGPHREQRP